MALAMQEFRERAFHRLQFHTTLRTTSVRSRGAIRYGTKWHKGVLSAIRPMPRCSKPHKCMSHMSPGSPTGLLGLSYIRATEAHLPGPVCLAASDGNRCKEQPVVLNSIRGNITYPKGLARLLQRTRRPDRRSSARTHGAEGPKTGVHLEP